MNLKSTVIVPLLLAFPAAVVFAPSAVPEATIKALYIEDTRSILGAGEGVMGSRAAREKFFSRAALKALNDDEKAAEKRGEPPTIEGDPFIDAEDPDFADLNISRLSVDDQTASVAAEFARPSEKVREKITYSLIFERGRWRIDDMIWGRANGAGETFRGRLKGAK
jgi:hypothetical protein